MKDSLSWQNVRLEVTDLDANIVASRDDWALPDDVLQALFDTDTHRGYPFLSGDQIIFTVHHSSRTLAIIVR